MSTSCPWTNASGNHIGYSEATDSYWRYSPATSSWSPVVADSGCDFPPYPTCDDMAADSGCGFTYLPSLGGSGWFFPPTSGGTCLGPVVYKVFNNDDSGIPPAWVFNIEPDPKYPIYWCIPCPTKNPSGIPVHYCIN